MVVEWNFVRSKVKAEFWDIIYLGLFQRENPRIQET